MKFFLLFALLLPSLTSYAEEEAGDYDTPCGRAAISEHLKKYAVCEEKFRDDLSHRAQCKDKEEERHLDAMRECGKICFADAEKAYKDSAYACDGYGNSESCKAAAAALREEANKACEKF